LPIREESTVLGATQGKLRLDPIALDHLTEKRSLCFRALDRHAPDAHLVSVPGLPYFRKEGEPAISGRIEPSKPAWGSNLVKKLPGQESKTEFQLKCEAILLGLITASLVLPHVVQVDYQKARICAAVAAYPLTVHAVMRLLISRWFGYG
jgi:hypothetical protein